MRDHYDVAIVGGGIVGLAHAWSAAKRNLRVILCERSPVARGASVRNFGMIWPIGQPAGPSYEIALRSRALWLELGKAGVLDVESCGSVHLAHREDELAVLEEFAGAGTHDVRMLTPEQTTTKSSLANPNGLLGAMESQSELRVDPRTASSRLAVWLSETYDTELHFSTPVVAMDGTTIQASDGRTWRAEQVVICSGSDLSTLLPEVFRDSGLKTCKLQMLRSSPQPHSAASPPHIASGLTLRHYTSFEQCPTHAALRNRIATETPELDRYGIHVMASQFPGGEVILGDSHEYGEDITPFDNSEIDDLIIRELRRVIRLSSWEMSQSWHGVYAKHPSSPVFRASVNNHVHVCTGTGGAGMTMSFGLAEESWSQWLGETN